MLSAEADFEIVGEAGNGEEAVAVASARSLTPSSWFHE